MVSICDLCGPECQILKKKKTPYGQEVGHESEVDAGILASSNQGVQVQ